MELPIVDVSALVVQNDEKEMEQVTSQIVNSLKKSGFIYITGHGISQDLINDAFSTAKTLFDLDGCIKGNFRRTKTENWGYVPFRVETFDKNRPFDLKECFNYYHSDRCNDIVKVIPNFEEVEGALFDECIKLTYLLMKAINTALPVDDKDYLKKTHNIGDMANNPSAMRLLYYPSIDNAKDILDGQLRCGEHSDYGTITLLFQDDAGGLQIVSPAGHYVDVKPIPGTIVVNCADLLDIWSSGTFKSTRHRVLIPGTTDACAAKARQSIAFFVSPNNDVTVENLDHSGRDDPVNALEYLWAQYAKSY